MGNEKPAFLTHERTITMTNKTASIPASIVKNRRFVPCVARYYERHAWTLVAKLDDLKQNLQKFGVGGENDIKDAVTGAEICLARLHTAISKRGALVKDEPATVMVAAKEEAKVDEAKVEETEEEEEEEVEETEEEEEDEETEEEEDDNTGNS